MKKLLLSVVAMIATLGVWAQENPLMAPIPNDEAVRIGKLENGLTYYIRHNEKPKDMANFWIVYNVGAIQEDDDQQGLAHFLEHMAFNGTKNLPGKRLIEYCEEVGVKFGYNLNAATSWDYTFYQLNDVPVKRDGVAREGVIDSMLLILHDWSHFIALEGDEIDSERGVIMEELRTTDGAQRRASMELIRSLGKGTRYAERNLIGHLDFLESFPHSAIRNFYEKWYRPELMTFIVVGDVDVDQIESKIKNLMADVAASPADAAQKDVIVVPDNEEPIISIFTDPEMQQSEATLYVKHAALAPEHKNTIMAALIDMVDSYLSTMANARLEEITMQPDAPFLSCYIHNGPVGIIPTLETAILSVTSKEGELSTAYGAALYELERMIRHGFTVGEFERAKANLQSSIERQWANRNDRENSTFVRRYMNHFQSNTAIPNAEVEYQLDMQLLNTITLDMVNGRVKELFPATNRVVAITAPEKEGLVNPTEQEVLALMAGISSLPAEQVAPYADNTVIEPLVSPDTVLKGSPVKKEVINEKYGSIEWTLKNGTKVILKPTTFKADELQLSAWAYGGSAMIENPDDAAIAQQLLPAIRSIMGVSKFSSVELQKQLTGKNVYLNPFVGRTQQGYQGASSPKDVEALLQLVYLNFTAPRFDQADYNTFYNQYKGMLENMNSNPDYIYQKEVMNTLYGGNARAQVVSAELLDKVQFERLDDINAILFPSANNFTFTFVGNIAPETLKPLVEKYIGSIPTSKTKLTVVDDGRDLVKGEVVNEFSVPMQQPKVGAFVCFSGEIDYNLKNELTMRLLCNSLSNRYLATVREQMGATYSIGAHGVVSHLPKQTYMIQVGCDTNSEKADAVFEAIVAELEKIATDGPLADDIEKAREYLVKDHKSRLEQNGYWVNYINEYIQSGNDFAYDYEPVIKQITYDDVKALAAKIVADKNIVKVKMSPAN